VNSGAVYKHTTQCTANTRNPRLIFTAMGAAFSIKNFTEHTINYSFTDTKTNAVVEGSLVPAEKRIEKKLKFTKQIMVTVRSDNPNLEELSMEIKTSHNAEYHNKYVVFVQDGKLTFKSEGTGPGHKTVWPRIKVWAGGCGVVMFCG